MVDYKSRSRHARASERRRGARTTFHSEVEVFSLDDASPAFTATTQDLCETGMFVYSRRAMPLRARVVIKVVLNGAPLRIKAVVVHRVPGVGFGCRFAEMSPVTQGRVCRLARWARGQTDRPRGADDTDTARVSLPEALKTLPM